MSSTGQPLRITFEGDWPRCFYDPKLLCGERETAIAGNDSPAAAELVRRGWHVADLCECPSCPVRCALSSIVWIEKGGVG